MNYTVTEMFYSLQGEGARAGTANVFIRFAGCNLQCTHAKEGFNCDTNFRVGSKMSSGGVDRQGQQPAEGCAHRRQRQVVHPHRGQPTLQMDEHLIRQLHKAGFHIAVESNGTQELPQGGRGVDWLSISPKPGHPVKQKYANEVRCVVKKGQTPDAQGITADHYFVSPAFYADRWETQDRLYRRTGELPTADATDLPSHNLKWCVEWCLRNPSWKLGVQQHKLWGVR